MNRCWKCGAGELEPAGDTCGNPAWHVVSSQPGACERCVCDQEESCSCCHVEPCQLQEVA